MFGPLAQHLQGVTAWAVDLRGHGCSPIEPGAPVRWQLWADDVLAALDGVPELDSSPRRPIGLGHSGGGAALLLAEQARPGTFASLYLYEPVVFPGLPPTLPIGNSRLVEGARLRRATFPSREAAEANFSSKPPMDRFDPAVLAAYLNHGFSVGDDGSLTLRCRPEDESRMYQMGRESGAWQALADVQCPVTVARGRVDDDSDGVALFADAVADALPHGHLEAHDDLGHFGPFEDPAAIAAALQRSIEGG